MAGLAKAQIRQLDANFDSNKPIKSITVQFNPESLKIGFANQVETQKGAGDQRGTPPWLFVGEGTTKLALELWFDATQPKADGGTVEDVRELTKEVVFFITPIKESGSKGKLTAPAVQFLWGSFAFNGVCESMEETLEFFSPEGRPLRAKLAISLVQKRIEIVESPNALPPGAAPAGLQFFSPASSGESMPDMAAKAGKKDWQGVAAANGIENPRSLGVGQLVDLNASVSLNASIAASAGPGVSLGSSARAGARLGFGVGVGTSLVEVDSRPGLVSAGSSAAAVSSPRAQGTPAVTRSAQIGANASGRLGIRI